MTRPWSAREVLNAAHADNRRLAEESGWYEDRLREHREDLRRLDAQVADAWEHLGAVLVPDLEPGRLDALALVTGLHAIGSEAIAAGTRAEVARLEGLRDQAAAAPQYRNREGIRNECSIRLAEFDELLAPLRAVYEPLHADSRWARLIRGGYGTENYAGRWWSLSYYRDWKEADELVEAFGPALGVTDHAGLLRKVEEAESAARVLQVERNEIAGRAAQVEALERQHDDAVLGLEQMPQRRLAAVRGRVRAHLQPLGEDRIAQLFPGASAVTIALQRLAGLAAQRRYLEAAAQRYIHEPRAQVQAIQARNSREIAKLSRPKNAGKQFDGAKMTKRFHGRPAAFVKRRERYEQTRTTVHSFHSYERGSLAQDFLWWDLITDGRIDGDFIPEVQHHHERFPDGYHDHAVAAVAERADDVDDMRMTDGS